MRSREQSHRSPSKPPPRRERLRTAAAVLLRDGAEFYLACRSPELRFFGGFHAAVGGAASAVDGEGEDRFAQAALRECLEETGLALFCRRAISPEERRDLLADDAGWRTLRSDFDTAALGDPDFRLVTPAFYPRCFDTHFFVVDLEQAGARREGIRELSGELRSGGWATPHLWLERWHRGEVLLVPPIVLLFEALVADGFSTETPVDSVRETLRKAAAAIESHPSQPIWNTPLARLVYLRTPTQPPAEHTNTYLVGHAPAYVVDPATPHAAERQTLLRCLDEEVDSGRRFEAILLTHDHPDHVGAADWLRERRGLPIWAHSATAERLEGCLPVDRRLDDGEVLPLGRTRLGDPWQLKCVHTPGHALGHLCFVDDRYHDLIAGDMVSTLSSILIDPRDGDLRDYRESLRKLVELRPRVLLPAHGPADGRGTRLLEVQLEHRRRRADQVLRAVDAGAASVATIVEQVYADVPPPQRALAGRSVISILRDLHRSGRWTTPTHDLLVESGILPSS